MRKTFTRSITAALTAATIATSIPLTTASAEPARTPAVTAAKAAPVASDEFSARRRYRGGNAAALGAFAAIIGTIGVLAATQSRNDYCGGYGCGYGYGYGPAPYAYYGGPQYYGRYHHRHW
jgi:hypothetical protein